MTKLFSFLALFLFIVMPAEAQHRYQTDFTAEDFQARREVIYETIGSNLAIIQGAAPPLGMSVFRQSNTFYYLSGLETASSYLLLDGRSKTTTLFLPRRTDGEPKISFDDSDLIKKITGVDDVQPLEKLSSKFSWPRGIAIYIPHSPDEKLQESRDVMLGGVALRLADPFDGRISKAGHFIGLIHKRYPQLEIRDLSPTLDKMRMIKDEKEIALIRTASQLAGLGIMEAIRSTKIGVKEYQLEAAAKFVFKNNGARDLSYNAIVATGKNTWYGHYSANADATEDGDMILMDLAPDYHYYTSDVTRVWPANGKYSKDQRDIYGFVIEYHKAFMRHLRPGLTPTQVVDLIVADMRPVLDKISFSKEIYREACENALKFYGHFQHPVGMSVHDVGRLWGKPLEVGMVFSIDPMVWVRPEKKYIRMEDIVVITKDGAELLSGNLPIEMDDLEALYQQEGIVQKRPPSLDKPFSTK